MDWTKRRLFVTLGALALVLSCFLAGCGGQTYNITVNDDEKLIESCPSKAEKGERVTIYTTWVADAELVVNVSGAEDGKFVRAGVYEFTMPAQDVKITARVDSSGYPGA